MSLFGSRAGRAGLSVRARHRLRDERGISLVEALVAIIIAGIVLTALANTTIASLVAINENERRTRANALANEVVEHLQGMPWEDAGFYDDDYTATPPAHVSLGATRPASEEPAAGDPCESNVPLLPSCDGVMRDGAAYGVDTQIVWVDDPADNDPVSGADLDFNPDDYKHFTVIAQWQARGQTAGVTVEAYRAPNAVERPVSAFDLTLDEVTPSDQVVTLTDPDLTDPVACPLQCRNDEPVTFRATTSVPSASVTLGWTARDGTSQTRYMTSSAGDTEWTYTITQGSERFANGETLFTLTATSPTGDEKKRYARVLFLHEVQVLTPTLSQTPISVGNNGRLCNPLTLEVEVQGVVTSDSVTASWSNGPAATALSPVTATKRGAVFRKVFPANATFTVGSTTLTLSATRSSDPATDTRSDPYTVVRAC
ncbi:hypothetical protein BH20ACT9_BH20ACT9_19630 [soil metagenome]